MKDLIVPLFSFTNCLISLILIFRSLNHCDIWSKAYHLKPAELLDEYVSSPFRLQLRRWLPAFSKLIEEIEFQFMHDIFCQQYSVQKKAFAFDEYANLVYERFILHIIELRLYHWAVFIAFLMFYWIPNRIVQDIYSCHDHYNENYCLQHGATILLIIFGTGLLFFTTCFGIASRVYLRAILQRNGLVHIDDYPGYLQAMDDAADLIPEAKRLGEDELKAVIQTALKDAASHHHSHSNAHHHRVIKEIFRWWSGVADSIKGFLRPSAASVQPSDASYNEDELRIMINESFKKVMESSVKNNVEVNGGCEVGQTKLENLTSPLHGKQKHHNFKHGHLRHVTDIFLFRRPNLYFEGVQMMLLPISLYFAVWMVEFSVYHEEAYLKVILLLLYYFEVC